MQDTATSERVLVGRIYRPEETTMAPFRTVPVATGLVKWGLALGSAAAAVPAFLFGMYSKAHLAAFVALLVLQGVDCWTGAEAARRTGTYDKTKDDHGWRRKMFRDAQLVAAWALDLVATHTGLWDIAIATGSCCVYLIGREAKSIWENMERGDGKGSGWPVLRQADRLLDDKNYARLYGTEPAPARRHGDAAVHELRDAGVIPPAPPTEERG